MGTLWRWATYALAAVLAVVVAMLAWARHRADRAEGKLDAYKRDATKAELKAQRRINDARAKLSKQQDDRLADERARLEAGKRDHMEGRW